jgi:N-acetylglucosamine-6-phosphate deacetylase
MTTYFAHSMLVAGKIRRGVLFTVDNGNISAVKTNTKEVSASDYDIELPGLVSPGFIDTQVNGGGGVLFNYDQSLSAIKSMVDGHAQFGTTSLVPTLITDSHKRMQAAADTIASAIEQDMKGIVGIHFEGPHLSVAKKGIHAAHHVRAISDKDLATITRQDIGKVIVTLAAETVSPDEIKDLVSQGVIVSLGHSGATIEQALAAIDAGATGFTHLYNAMSGLSAREPGLIAAALLDERVTSGLIVDLHHVHPYNCKLAFHSIGTKRLMLVTDAMAQVGSELKTLPWLDSTIRRHDTKLTLDDGSLAGSCLDMASAVRNMNEIVSKDLPSVLAMASKTPADFLGLNTIGEIKVGKLANFVLLDEKLHCVASWICGTQVAGTPQ